MTKTFSISCPRRRRPTEVIPSKKFNFDCGNILKIKLEDGTLITVEVSEWGSVSVYPPKQGKDKK